MDYPKIVTMRKTLRNVLIAGLKTPEMFMHAPREPNEIREDDLNAHFKMQEGWAEAVCRMVKRLSRRSDTFMVLSRQELQALAYAMSFSKLPTQHEYIGQISRKLLACNDADIWFDDQREFKTLNQYCGADVATARIKSSRR